ncbi:MAG: DUF349 domain-containing protein [Bacteroidales bacterium]|nr:DUF349 domain-containing protein [Bacteroidales bacterium]
MEETTPLQQAENEQLQQQPEAEATETQANAETVEATEPAVQAETPEASKPEEHEAEPVVDYSAMDRESLLACLEELLHEEVQRVKGRAQAVRTRFGELTRAMQQQEQDAFVEAGGNRDDFKAQDDPLADRFYQLYDQYREKRQQFIEQLEEQKKKNLEAKRALIEELRGLVDSGEEQVRASLDRFADIQERWKNIGDVPRDQMNDLWQNYHFHMEQFFAKLQQGRELRALDQKRNLEQKITLCERAEELIVEPSVSKAFKGLQDLRAQWKEIGPVPQEQNEEIWQRFQTAAARIDQRRREYYDQLHAEQESNLLAKQALVEKATELTAEQPQGARRWNEVTTALDELLKVWKTIGPVPREVNEEIWAKFKGIIDKHYSDKKEYFSTVRDQQDSNYQKKVDLCLKAEAIAERDDWKKATEELLQLQKEWREIGSVSRKVSDKVWHRFRSACDRFFERKGAYFADRRSSEGESLAKKQAIIEELKAHEFGDDRNENLNVIKDFQRRWAEAGYVPMAEKDRLQKEFRGLVDGIFERLKISAREAEATAYRERIRSMGGDTRRFVHDERQELTDRIEKLRSDLALWENNLGFLASSKQADLLKQEFDKKMQGARQQIALLQAKLRILVEESKKEEAEK